MKKNANHVFDESNIKRNVSILISNNTGFLKSSKIKKQVIRDNGPTDHNIWFKFNGDEVELGIVNGTFWQLRVHNKGHGVSYLYSLNNFLQYCIDNQRKNKAPIYSGK